MRVLHVTPSIARSYGGPTHSLLGYVHASREAGLEVEVAAPDPGAEDMAWLRQELTGAQTHLFPSVGSGAFVSAGSLIRWLKGNGGRFDVVHVHGLLNPISSLSARACIQRGWSLVIRPFGMLSQYTFNHRRRGLKLAYHRALDRPNLRRVGGVHFTSAGERDGAAWLGLGLEGRSYVVPPPVPVTAGTALERSEAPLVVCIARLNPVKRLEALIDAWPGVVAAVPDARLTVAG